MLYMHLAQAGACRGEPGAEWLDEHSRRAQAQRRNAGRCMRLRTVPDMLPPGRRRP